MSDVDFADKVKKAKKTVTRNIRMTLEQVRELDQFLEEVGMSFSAFVRQAILLRQPLKNGKLARRYKAPPPKNDPDLLLELGRIGNNINQIARSLNYIKADQLLRAEFSFIECLKVLQSIQNDLHSAIGTLPAVHRSDQAAASAKRRAMVRASGNNHAD